MLFSEAPFLERFGMAAEAGFEAVEFLFPYAERPEDIAGRLRAHGLKQVLFNGPPGDWEKGERGLGALPDRQAEFRESILRALDYARILGCGRLHVMAGIPPAGCETAACDAVFRENLLWAAERAAEFGVTILIEPLNPVDMPGYFLNRIDQAAQIVRELHKPNLRLQFDVYHTQMMQGQIAATFAKVQPIVGHIQIAGVPGRCEPDDRQEINYPYLFGLIANSGYEGWIGCEYRPRAGTSQGLAWMGRWRQPL